MKIRSEKLGDKVSETDCGCPGSTESARCLQIFEWGDKDVAQADNLSGYV